MEPNPSEVPQARLHFPLPGLRVSWRRPEKLAASDDDDDEAGGIDWRIMRIRAQMEQMKFRVDTPTGALHAARCRARSAPKRASNEPQMDMGPAALWSSANLATE